MPDGSFDMRFDPIASQITAYSKTVRPAATTEAAISFHSVLYFFIKRRVIPPVIQTGITQKVELTSVYNPPVRDRM